MHHEEVIKDFGMHNRLVVHLHTCAKESAISDDRFPTDPPQMIFRKWGGLIRADFDRRNHTLLKGQERAPGFAVINNLSGLVTDMNTKFDAHMRSSEAHNHEVNQRYDSTVQFLHGRIGEVEKENAILAAACFKNTQKTKHMKSPEKVAPASSPRLPAAHHPITNNSCQFESFAQINISGSQHNLSLHRSTPLNAVPFTHPHAPSYPPGAGDQRLAQVSPGMTDTNAPSTPINVALPPKSKEVTTAHPPGLSNYVPAFNIGIPAATNPYRKETPPAASTAATDPSVPKKGKKRKKKGESKTPKNDEADRHFQSMESILIKNQAIHHACFDNKKNASEY